MTTAVMAEARTARTARSRFVRDGLVLGLLTVLGPFAIDMYLPSLPAIGRDLGVGPDAVLFSLTAYFATFAVGQLVFGPISDLVGRKPPLYAGVLLFLGASVGCALAGDLQTLIAFRVLEGLGGAAGMVIARAVVRDLHSGHDEVRLLSLLMLVFSVSPVLAPMVGSFVIAGTSWQVIFWLIAGLAVVGLVCAVVAIPETRPRELRGGNLASVWTASRRLLRHRTFVGLTLVGGFATAGFFVFLANSSFVFTGQYGLSPMEYSLVFSVNAGAFFAGMQASGRLARRYGLRRIVVVSVAAYASVTVLLLGLTAAGVDNLAVVVALLFAAFTFLGLGGPAASVLALADHGDVAGTASSLMGTIQLVLGAVLMSVTSSIADGTVLPMTAAVAACAVLAFVLTFALARKGK
jgi:DHA1 family bicyclomycin/chloramphenicol resistance-like MFS transporter